jgi:subtilisin family serine protease
MNHQSDPAPDSARPGCSQPAAMALLLLWLAAVPIVVQAIADLGLAPSLPRPAASALTVGLTALAIAIPAGLVFWTTRRHPTWRGVAALALGLVAVAGFAALDMAIRALLPAYPTRAAALRLALLLPFSGAAAWALPRLFRTGPPDQPFSRRLGQSLGLERPDLPGLLIALAVAGTLALPWPRVGSLGDSLESLKLALQALATALPEMLLFMGLIFGLLTATFRRSWAAGLVTILIYALYTPVGVVPGGNWAALWPLVGAFPLDLLLTELRARGGSSIWPPLIVAFCYRAFPLLFIDPRSEIANGIPDIAHILSYLAILIVAGLLGLLLWGGRKLLAPRLKVTAAVATGLAGVAALAAWGAWAGLYLFAGYPGFHDDGYLIILKEQANLSAAYPIAGRAERLQYVYDRLRETANRTQQPIRAELDTLGLAYRPYYIINMIRVDGTRRGMDRFVRNPAVAQVMLNPNVRPYPFSIPFPETRSDSARGVEWNIARTGADKVWAQGFTGQGVVIADADTGVDWQHPALIAHYRGRNGSTVDHTYNWHDAWGESSAPQDADGHGTYTTAIVVGDDGQGNQVGMAPGAQWIACRNMRRGVGNPGSYAECLEWLLAPYPSGGDPFADGDVAKAPHVVNNSWGCPAPEGCQPDTLRLAVEALRAAGIMMVVSAGNSGPACDTVTDPPAPFDASFTVGATDAAGQVAVFSSRGPVEEGGQPLLKPDVVAPGQDIRSAQLGGGYSIAAGTSASGPHVAGLVALLWSANPGLIGDIDRSEQIVRSTARPVTVSETCTGDENGGFLGISQNPVCACGGESGSPNDVYGWGEIDALKAIGEARQP